MRPRIFHQISRFLAILLERGIRERSGENRIPVFVGHPLDLASEAEETDGERAVGVLYLCRIGPSGGLKPPSSLLERSAGLGVRARWRRPGAWVTLRYAFLVVGGAPEEELAALAGVLMTLDARPWVLRSEVESDDVDASLEPETRGEADAWPLRVIDSPEAWREIGLTEHRLLLSFEVSVPLVSGEGESVETILERDVVLERDGAIEGGAARQGGEDAT